MAGNPTDKPDEGSGKIPDMSVLSEAELAARFDNLSGRLDEHRKEVREARRADARSGDTTGYARAVRLGSEFIGGILVGAAIGWFIDRSLGSSPWGLIIFLLVGFGAGTLNVLRSEGQLSYRDKTRPPGQS